MRGSSLHHVWNFALRQGRSHAFVERDGYELNACIAGLGIKTDFDIYELSSGESIEIMVAAFAREPALRRGLDQ